VDIDMDQLNERAKRLGYEIVLVEPGGHMANMGGLPNLEIRRDGKPCFKTPWSYGEVDQWLGFRQKDADNAAKATLV
jgi:hypothetical protein